MSHDAAPTTFADAMDWIGSRSGLYVMKVEGDRIVISVRVGGQNASEAVTSMEESDLEDALVRAIRRIAGAS
jgi:hypothetical protein